MSNWNHPLCESCWREWSAAKFGDPDREPVRLVGDLAEDERCASCGTTTHSGIYVRATPGSMPHSPREDEAE